MSRVTLFLALQLLAFWPVWTWYAARMTDSSDEPWGLLALGTALFFILRKGRGSALKASHLALSSIFVFAYILTYSSMPALGRAALAVMAIGCTLSPSRLGRPVHVGVVGLLLLSLPIIASLQFYLGYPVRALTAVISSRLIGLTGYEVHAQGTCLYWAGEVISIDAPCTGVRMLWTGLYLNFTLACLAEHSSARTWLTHSFSMLVIFLGNVLRSSALFYTESGILHGPAWAHQGIGLAVFALIAVAILRFNRRMGKSKGELQCT
jgi:exosortase